MTGQKEEKGEKEEKKGGGGGEEKAGEEGKLLRREGYLMTLPRGGMDFENKINSPSGAPGSARPERKNILKKYKM